MNEATGSVALVIPCYNEAVRLQPEVFLRFLESRPRVHFILVDDGSTDTTWSLLEEMRARQPERICTLRLERNRGKAEAVRQGMVRAAELSLAPGSGISYAGYWDADLSTPLEALDRFEEAFAQDPERMLVMGSRVRLLGRRIVRKAHRHYLGRVFSTLASLSLDLPVYDTQCGAKLFRTGEELRALFSHPFSDPWLFDVEILARLRSRWGRAAEDRIYELPLTSWQDVGGSKIRLRDGGRATVSLALIWLRRVRAQP